MDRYVLLFQSVTEDLAKAKAQREAQREAQRAARLARGKTCAAHHPRPRGPITAHPRPRGSRPRGPPRPPQRPYTVRVYQERQIQKKKSGKTNPKRAGRAACTIGRGTCVPSLPFARGERSTQRAVLPPS